MLRTITNNLPAFVEYEGCTFQLVILFLQQGRIQMAYIITAVESDSKHYRMYDSIGSPGEWKNPFTKSWSKSLIVKECTPSSQDLRLKAYEIKNFLQKYLAKSLANPNAFVP